MMDVYTSRTHILYMKRLSGVPPFIFRSYLLRANPIIKNIILKKFKSPLEFYLSQSGGAINSLSIVYQGETFVFHEYIQGYWTLSDEDNRDCVAIGINPKWNEAYINNINADTVRSGNTIMTQQGSHLFKITLAFLKEYKDRLNINKITLTDNSQKYCPNSTKMIRLPEFLTLLTGHTWYGKHGFRPLDSESRADYRKNRDIMFSVRLQDVDFSPILQKMTKLKDKQAIRQDQYDYFMDVYNRLKDGNLLVKDLLQEIFNKSSYDFICSVFDRISFDLTSMLKLHVRSHELYILPIEAL